MFHRFSLAAIAALTLAGCQTTTTGTNQTTGPDTQTANGLAPVSDLFGIENATDVSFDLDTLTLTVDGTDYDLTEQPALAHGVFDYYGVSGNTHSVAMFGTSASGRTGAGVAYIASGGQGIFYQRIGQTVLPTKGTATFNGDYIATVDAQSAILDILGDAELTADFSASTISGSITNRQSWARNLTPPTQSSATVDDVTLQTTAITATGSFAGTATGGDYNDATSTSVSTTGRYEGVIGGGTGNEVVGGVVIEHDNTNNVHDMTEFGAFVAN